MELQSHYDAIAEEYYSTRHITSRNFDNATLAALTDLKITIPNEGLVLEFGSGKGRSIEFLRINPSRIIHLDSSIRMLELIPREESIVRILSNAHSTPFLDQEFNVCTAFLCDPFWSTEFLKEAFRILKKNGMLLATMPSYQWGSALREELGVDITQTKFVNKEEQEIIVPSKLVPKESISHLLISNGFKEESIKIISCKLPPSEEIISPHITISANKQRKSAYDIELVDIIIAIK